MSMRNIRAFKPADLIRWLQDVFDVPLVIQLTGQPMHIANTLGDLAH
jgi:hypothetical protein